MIKDSMKTLGCKDKPKPKKGVKKSDAKLMLET